MKQFRRLYSIVIPFIFLTLFIGGCVTKARFESQMAKSQSLSDQLKEEKEQNRKLKEERSSFEARLLRLTSELSSVKQNASENFEKFKKGMDHLEEKLALAKEFGEVSKKTFEAELKDLNTSYEGVLQKARRRVNEFQENLGLRGEELSDMKERFSAQAEQLLARGKAFAEKELDLLKLKARMKGQTETLEQLHDRLADQEEEEARLRGVLLKGKAQRDRMEREMKESSAAHDNLIDKLKKEISDGSIKITRLKNKLSVEIVDKILFSSGSDQITAEGKGVLKKVSEVLQDVQENDIRIEGHTDNVPIGLKLKDRFASNWELSTARATQVVRFLEAQKVPSERMLAAGHSKYRPVVSNETAEGKQRNRRIEIVLFPRDVSKLVDLAD